MLKSLSGRRIAKLRSLFRCRGASWHSVMHRTSGLWQCGKLVSIGIGCMHGQGKFTTDPEQSNSLHRPLWLTLLSSLSYEKPESELLSTPSLSLQLELAMLESQSL